MAECYAEAAYPLNRRRAAEGFAALLADERLGHVWFIQADSQDVGHVVVTLCFSMEYAACSLSSNTSLNFVNSPIGRSHHFNVSN